MIHHHGPQPPRKMTPLLYSSLRAETKRNPAQHNPAQPLVPIRAGAQWIGKVSQKRGGDQESGRGWVIGAETALERDEGPP